MGQLWDRIRRVSESYINDVTKDIDLSKIDPKILEELRARKGASSSSSSAGSSSSSTHRRGYETEEERLKRMIDEAANPQARNNSSSSSQGNSSNQKQQSRHHNPHANGGMNVEGALQVLGLAVNASNEDIKRTYKKLMMQYHPDRVSHLDTTGQNQARDKAQRINQAYQIIKDVKGL